MNVAWLLVIWTGSGMTTLPTHYPNEDLCIKSAKAAYVQSGFGKPYHGWTGFICIPGHSPLHGGKETN